MKNRHICLAMLMLGASSLAFAQSDCSAIQDSDQRAYCNAREGLGQCESISDGNLAAICRAELEGGSCYFIKDNDQRAYCFGRQGDDSDCSSISDSELRSQCYALAKRRRR
ncbi:hypothetical protein PCO31010_03664 [Pandoraea commovens]|uniref:Lipoprotein n=1 Tax=Pandoraea commovens TaxID=2508289 RepID=A0A5E4X3T6_9BURK|nr:hypothetical protein PCO31010_03664 [Pandoraea commovens]